MLDVKSLLLQALRRTRADRTSPLPLSTRDGDRDAFNNVVLEIHALITAGNLAQASQRIARLTATRPNDPDLQFLLGLIALRQSDNLAAVAHFEKAVALQPELGAAHIQLAQLYDALHEADRAQACYEAAVSLMPEVAELHNALGVIYLARQRLSDAERSFVTTLRLKPGLAAAQNNLGRVYSERKQYHAAIACFRKAMDLDSSHIHARINTGLTLNQLGEYEQAHAILLGCRAEAPDHLEVIHGLGSASFALGRLPQAERYYRECLTLDRDYANAHFGLANIALLHGDLAAGWEQYEWRTRLPRYAQNYKSEKPLWQGEPVNGKTLLVNAEQGFGDVLLFSRFLPMISRWGAQVIFRCDRSLVRLMENCGLANRVLETDAEEPVTADISIPLLSLGRALGIGLADLPGPVPYIWAPANLVESWRRKLGGDDRLRVGLAWGGNAQRVYQRARVPSRDNFSVLSAIPGVAFYNLQLGFGAQDIARFPVPLIDLTSEIEDFADTAALVENLDLVISVDTSAAHLCGAMGKPTWILHPGVPDWRWEIGEKASPWYPTVRLFRRQNGDWAQVFAEIASTLDEHTRHLS